MIRVLRALTPPIALALFRRLTAGNYGFSGNFRSWEEARALCAGYDAEVILERVKNALLRVKEGEALFERDSVLFDKPEYSWPLLTALLTVVSRSGNRLNLLDFGGSLGSTYYQNIKFLEHLDEFEWSIVEQSTFVECGKRWFENDRLKFYLDLDACISDRSPNAILFSSVIQYLEKPYELLADVIERGFSYLIFDRTPFLEKGDDRITVQKVPPEIYPASYPAWFFNLDKFLDFFAADYELLVEFDSFEAFHLGDVASRNKGFVFRKK